MTAICSSALLLAAYSQPLSVDVHTHADMHYAIMAPQPHETRVWRQQVPLDMTATSICQVMGC